MNPFVYCPLHDPVCSIRLVEIYPPQNNSDDAIKCSLETVNINSCPDYCGLSYVWGCGGRTQSIVINDATMMVTENLSIALQHLRALGVTTKLWVDSLCIDQDNEDEKNGQVQRMKSIFQQAKAVFGWLGPADDNSDMALSMFHTIANQAEALGLKLGTIIDIMDRKRNAPAGAFNNMFGTEAIFSDFLDRLFDFHPLHREYIAELFHKPFWDRIWILQEMVVAQDVVFVCGHLCLQWGSFMLAFIVIVNSFCTFEGNYDPENFWLLPNECHPFQINMARLNGLLDRQNENTLGSYLKGARRTLEATDPRDMIYALLGIASDVAELDIAVDYRQPFTELYVEVAKKFLRKYGLKLLSWAEGINRDTNALPSWVPDWRTSQSTTISSCWNPFNWATNPTPEVIFDPIFPMPLLRVYGIHFDRLSRVGQPWYANFAGRRPIDAIVAWFQEVEEISTDSSSSFSSEYKEEAIMLSPIAGKMEEDERLGYGYLRGIRPVPEQIKVLDPKDFDEWRLRQGGRYIRSMGYSANKRKAFVSVGGYIGLGPQEAKKGDSIVAFPGADVPFILRHLSRGRYRLLGEAYVHGMCHECPLLDQRQETFILV